MQSEEFILGNRENISVFYDPSPYKPLGFTYSYWSKKWYEWVQSIRREENPATDNSGKNCCQRQSNPVWFLAGTPGGTARRNCSIPAGENLFFPIINEMSTTTQCNKSGQNLINYCSSIIDQVTNKEVMFDHEKLVCSQLDPYRIRTDLFDFTLPQDNLCGVAAGPTAVVCDGYWIMIKNEALSAGNHILHFLGEQADGFRTEVTYNLMIE